MSQGQLWLPMFRVRRIARSNALIRVALKTPAMSAPLFRLDCAFRTALNEGTLSQALVAPGLRLMFPQLRGKRSCERHVSIAIYRKQFETEAVSNLFLSETLAKTRGSTQQTCSQQHHAGRLRNFRQLRYQAEPVLRLQRSRR